MTWASASAAVRLRKRGIFGFAARTIHRGSKNLRRRVPPRLGSRSRPSKRDSLQRPALPIAPEGQRGRLPPWEGPAIVVVLETLRHRSGSARLT